MYDSDVVRAVQRLYKRGYRKSEILSYYRMSRVTLNRLLAKDPDNLAPVTRNKPSKLDPYSELLQNLFLQYRDCRMVCDEFKKQVGLEVTLRRIQQYLKPFRESLAKKKRQPKSASAATRSSRAS